MEICKKLNCVFDDILFLLQLYIRKHLISIHKGDKKSKYDLRFDLEQRHTKFKSLLCAFHKNKCIVFKRNSLKM